ncbi:MAG: hypothetical protein IPK34_17220 [Ramlibacter sp.]|nr:hypothetical protein [Ramlibacter sp.]
MGQRFSVTGHGEFFSAPMCDAFLILGADHQRPQPPVPAAGAAARGGASGGDNAINAIRVSSASGDKLGNKATASVRRVPWRHAPAGGRGGRGIPQILGDGHHDAAGLRPAPAA